MNANEVIAAVANSIVAVELHANDHVNLGQSSNDVIPTALHVSAVMALHQQLIPALIELQTVVSDKAAALQGVVKTGRTHLMDAMPISFEQSLGAWATQLKQNIVQLQQLVPRLSQLVMGGTAVGTGVNSHNQFPSIFNQALSQATGLKFEPAQDFVAGIAAQDLAVALSGDLKTVAVTLMKIANDLRLMNSGPLTGYAEIQLQALQPGSSIMPGKVNPVMPEAVAMVAAEVMGNDTTVTIAGQSGQFELNTMLPLLADKLLSSIALLSSASHLLGSKAIKSFVVNEKHIKAHLQNNPILVTALNPIIGYEKAAKIAKAAYQQQRAIYDVALELSGLSKAELDELLDPNRLTRPEE